MTSRIGGIVNRPTGLGTKIAYFFTRRALRALAGRETERMLEPLALYALLPGLLRAYGGLEEASGKLRAMDVRLRNLAELKTATLTGCEYCIDLGSAIARRSGLSDEQLLALPTYRSSPLFTDLEKLVLDYAVGMSRTPVDVPDALFAGLARELDETQLVELTHRIALENMRGRFNHALGVGSSGFSEGVACAVPDRTAIPA